MEKQFRRYYNKALSQTGNTAELFLQHLERRLDNIVYRLGLARSRQEARQITTHGWILVNNKRVNIPSYEVKMGDVIALKEGAGKSARWQAIEQYNSTRTPIGWLAFDNKSLSGKVMSLPTKDDFPQNMNMTLVVEYYSR